MCEVEIKTLRWPHVRLASRRFQGLLKGESMVRNKRSICDSRSPSPGAGSTVGRARMLHPALEALFLFCKMKFGTLISLAVAGIKRASGRKIFNSVLTPAGRSVNMRRCWRRRAGLGLGLGLYRGQNWGAGRWDLGNHLVECFSNPAVIRIAWKLPVLLCWADTCTRGSIPLGTF